MVISAPFCGVCFFLAELANRCHLLADTLIAAAFHYCPIAAAFWAAIFMRARNFDFN